MKNKIITYFLITAVLSIWSIILYRIFAGASEAEIKVGKAKFVQPKPENKMLSDEKIPLALNYRDPFLNKVYFTAPVAVLKVLKPERVAIPESVNWDVIKYTGYIQNPKTGSVISLIRINNKEYMLADGETAAGFKLVRNNKESITVAWKKQTKHIRL